MRERICVLVLERVYIYVMPATSFFLTLSPTFTEAAKGIEEAMATRARGRMNFIMIKELL